MMYELSISSHFAAAHLIRGYDGPCKDLHGHTWKCEVTVFSDELNEIGLVMDFKDLKEKLGRVVDQLDHKNLNDLPAFQDINPSTENIARFIYQTFADLCRPLKVKQVRVWESERASVTYYE